MLTFIQHKVNDARHSHVNHITLVQQSKGSLNLQMKENSMHTKCLIKCQQGKTSSKWLQLHNPISQIIQLQSYNLRSTSINHSHVLKNINNTKRTNQALMATKHKVQDHHLTQMAKRNSIHTINHLSQLDPSPTKLNLSLAQHNHGRNLKLSRGDHPWLHGGSSNLALQASIQGMAPSFQMIFTQRLG